MSLTLAEARARAAAVSQVAYEVELDLTDAAGGTFGSRTVVDFTTTASSTFLELTAADALSVRVDGVAVEPDYDGERITLTGLGGTHRVAVEARLPYVTDGDGMHTMTDPADGEIYVGAYLGMDIARKTFCCFDQNDLKAPLSMRVVADPRWTVLANGADVSPDAERAAGRWTFATTPPIPPLLAVVAAGPWASRRWQHAGLTFGWHARASLGSALERDLPELRAITEACFAHYRGLFEEPYAFDSYDQVFVPGLNWGAQEMPGCITYRDELLPADPMPEHRRAIRAMIIAHEMAHMWFGDLVTMTWWEDTWLQESFADYMGFRVAAEGVGLTGVRSAFEADDKGRALVADRRRSTHPVAPRPEQIPDVDAAATIFDSISYAKGGAVLRQLATWLGDETFLRGINLYLGRHRFGNATLEDLMAAVDEAAASLTPRRDVRAWAQVWLRTPGHDTIAVHRGDDVPVLRRTGIRPHRFTVTAYDEQLHEVGRRVVDLADDPVALVEFRGRIVVPNALGETFARVLLDDVSASHLRAGLHRIDDPVVRAVLWTGFADAAHLTSPADHLELVTEQLPLERDAAVAAAVVDRVLWRLVPQQVPAEQAEAVLATLAAACGEGIARTTNGVVASALLPGWTAGTRAVGALLRALREGAVGVAPLAGEQRWAVIRRLCALGEWDAEQVEAERLATPGVAADLGSRTALAARPTPQAKAEAWALASAPDVDNRRFLAAMRGLWTAGQDDLVAPYVGRYLTEAPGWAARGQAFAKVVDLARPALRPSPDDVALLRRLLAGPLPTVLRRGWEDWSDDLG